MVPTQETRSVTLSLSAQQRIHEKIEQFIEAWKRVLSDNVTGAERPSMKDYMGGRLGDERAALFRELLDADLHFRLKLQEIPKQSDYERMFPDLSTVIQQALSAADDSADRSFSSTAAQPGKAAAAATEELSPEPLPDRLGRYRVQASLGAGSFGSVYRAYDDKLDRHVAIKVPHRYRISGPSDVEQYLNEARILARLEHPHIVPVYDFGQLEDGRCYVVSKWIEGTTLAQRIDQGRLSFDKSADVAATIAEALHVAHQQKIVHRDIKPGNILLDSADRPYVTDFGLAMREEDFGKLEHQGMTPAYASPEQAQGEGHLVDGRSDIFSLGVVLYELLTGERPFRGPTQKDVLAKVKRAKVWPLRQLDSSIPSELERICLKALSRRASDRYSTAFDMAEDLRHFLAGGLTHAEPPDGATTPVSRLRIFISYRREDAKAFVGRLNEHLKGRYGSDSVFLDVDSLRVGEDFRQQIESYLDDCDVFLAIISPGWLRGRRESSRAHPGEEDFVRLEAEAAFAQGLRVIPILVGNTPALPKDELPVSLRTLADLHACRIDDGEDFPWHLERLTRELDAIALGAERDKETTKDRASTRRIGQSAPIVPKGLRSFDENDTEFFLQLLEGPRDRNGLPTSVRSWKNRIEQTDPEQTFRVGLIYGPSGCGKSSFVRAGLLPRLSEQVRAVYLESTPEETESVLLRRLAPHGSGLARERPLPEVLATVRQARTGTGQKVLLVLDQFEQWLHSHPNPDEEELVASLRQCDGQHLQCLILVRDDFQMAVHRFMRAMEVPMRDGHNRDAIDLFSPQHARRVLALFGQAYGRQPGNDGEFGDQQNEFLDHAIEQLAEQDQVICLRLALFAEMMRSREWTLSNLKKLGGAEGLGAVFLQETFSEKMSPPEHKYHEEGVRGVLKALLPRRGTVIATQAKSYSDLLAASGYEGRDRDFRELLTILTYDVRLITPSDRETCQSLPDTSASKPNGPSTDPTTRLFRLTHDYLVPSIRNWLMRKQRETWRGRAALVLQERSQQWQTSPEARFLPSPLEYLRIQAAVPWKKRTSHEKDVMRAAARRYGVATLLVLSLVGVLGAYTWNESAENQAKVLVARIRGSGSSSEFDDLINNELPPYRERAARWLDKIVADTQAPSLARARASRALLSQDPSQVTFLVDEMIHCDPADFGAVRDCLRSVSPQLEDSLWRVFRGDGDSNHDERCRLNAGMALAAFAPQSANWSDFEFDFFRHQLASRSVQDQSIILANLAATTNLRIPNIASILLELQQVAAARQRVQVALAAYSKMKTLQEKCDYLVGAMTNVSTEDFATIFDDYVTPLLNESRDARERLRDRCVAQFTREPAAGDGEQERVTLGRQKAAAAIALVRLGYFAESLAVFDVHDDPESLTQCVHLSRSRGVSVSDLVKLLESADLGDKINAQYAVLLALGEFDWQDVPISVKKTLRNRIVTRYQRNPSAAVHSAARWLLCKWGQNDELARLERELESPPKSTREWFVEKLQLGSQSAVLRFVVVPAGTYEVGASEYENDRQDDEVLHNVTLSRPVAVMAQEVPLSLWKLFRSQYNGSIARFHPPEKASTDDHPIDSCDWYSAVEFCRWLTEQNGMPADEQFYVDPSALPADQIVTLRDGRKVPQNWPVNRQGKGFRLLTEAEWEIACRAGSGTTYSFGNDRGLLEHYAWYYDNSAARLPQKCGQKRPNRYGLFDMHGNVLEWCHDGYQKELGGDLVDPLVPSVDTYRVLRGGSFGYPAADQRSALRWRLREPDAARSNGFRIAKTIQ